MFFVGVGGWVGAWVDGLLCNYRVGFPAQLLDIVIRGSSWRRSEINEIFALVIGQCERPI